MSTRYSSFPRLIAAAAIVLGSLAVAPAVGAQTCAYNSTQGTCACPTSGAGTSCFGGQLFKSSDNSCQNDVRPCLSNQNWDCSSEACVCNTASYPCGGCTAASSTIGATCSAPTNGKYTNVCGACACPSGTTICSSSNTCVTTLSCPAGTTFDPCTNSCGTPNVLLSPGWIQSGFIQVNGDVKSTGGNLRMDQATGAGQGDTYIANGKAIRVDGAGVTSLSIGNWGAGGSSVNVFENGNHFAFGLSTIPSDNAVAANTIETGNLCLGNGINCRSSWPASTDFDPTYVNVTGDTMTGDLNLSGATADIFVGGKAGIGTTTPANKLDVGGSAVVGSSFAGATAAPANGMLVQGAVAIGPGALSFSGHLFDVTVPGPLTTPFVTFRDNASGVQLDFSRNSIVQRGSNFVLDTDAGDVDIQTYGTSKVYIQRTSAGGNVGIGTTTPGAKLDVNGTAKMTGFLLPTGAGAGRFLTSDASGNGSWSPASIISGSGTANYVSKFTAASTLGNSTIFDNGTAVGIGTASPAAGVKLDVNGAVKGSTFTNAASPMVSGNLVIQPTAGTAAIVVGTANATQFFQVQNTLGQAALDVDTTNMRVGVGTAAPAAALHVSGGALLVDSASGALPATGAGTRLMWYPSKAAFRAGIIMSGRTEWDDANIGTNSVAFGLNSQSSGTYSFSNGNNTHATGDSSEAFGLSTFATNTGAVAMGNGNTASGYSAVALGNNTVASGTHTLAYGSGSQATGDYSTAGGLNSTASGNGTIAIGWGAHAAGGVGLGDNVYATGSDSVALGFASQATNTSATVSGYQSTGSGFATTAMGYNTTASGYAATAFGQSATAAGDRSVAMGYNSTANGPGSVALGAYNSTGTSGYATAVGYASSAGGQYSFAGGYAATASGDQSFAFGQAPTASGYSSFSLGQYVTSSASYSSSFGDFINNSAYKSVTIGSGYDGTSGGMLANNVGYSIMLGTNSNLPTMTVTNGGGVGSTGKVGIGTTTPAEKLEINGNLKFTPANPYISASSYFIAPGGAYFNSGTVYAEAAIQARGGIHNDTGGNLVLEGGTSGVTSTTGPMQVNAGSGGYGLQANGTSGTWGPSVGVNNGSQEWRMVSWSGNELKFVKITGSTFTPFTIYNNAYQDELELKSNGISLSGKHAFRSDDSWLRLNQDGAFTSGVHTPGLFAPMSLNVGGYGGWVNPGSGNASINGDLIAENNSWGSGNGWIYCGTNSSCWCPGGMFVIAELNYNYYYGYSYIYCAKP